MVNQLKTILSGRGFYAALALCVLAAGAGGWFLLMDDDSRDAPVVAEEPPQAQAAAPAPEITAPEHPVAETIQPEPLEAETQVETPPPMPEEAVDNVPVVAEAPRLIVEPLQGEVVAAFSVDQLVYSETLGDWRTHDGVDIAAETGATVLAACSGTVRDVTDDVLMGTTVILDHPGGYQTTYANLQPQLNVEKGDSVSAGQILGAVGDSAAAEAAQGPHLHFSVTKDGDTVDPNEFLEG